MAGRKNLGSSSYGKCVLNDSDGEDYDVGDSITGFGSSYGKCVLSDSDEEDYDVGDSITGFGLSLEKLNLGPRKKLLVLNLNGILVHRVHRRRHSAKEIPKNRTPDGRYGNFHVYKRPFSEDFMKFCFERFEVGIWSSAMEHNIDAALECAMGSLKSKLLFIWDQNQCTDSGFKSLEKKHKPLFFKELKNVWEKVKRGGPYSASNTLLIDDKPYEALLNPPYTGIFPEPYNPEDKNDAALDPKSELGMYLEGLSEAEDVVSYVKKHPFAQPAISSSHPDWSFYSLVLKDIGNN